VESGELDCGAETAVLTLFFLLFVRFPRLTPLPGIPYNKNPLMTELHPTDQRGNTTVFPFDRTLFRSLTLSLMLVCFAPGLFAQEGADAEDPFDREIRFINYLLDTEMLDYVNPALEELRDTFPDQVKRVEVAEAGVKLRLGKTDEVEALLATRDLNTDMKAQAILLNLAMTYDAIGNEEKAMESYRKFLRLNEGKEITDPDVVRLFASAGMRLAAILGEQGDFDGADRVLKIVIDSTDKELIKRMFSVKAAQNQIDKALTLSGNSKAEALKAAEKLTEPILWGANDNYMYMAMGLRAWVKFERGNIEDAVSDLQRVRKPAIQLEKRMKEEGIPASEYPRAALRYVEGLIQLDAAKKAAARNDKAAFKTNAEKALGNFFNAFLKYEGNEYAAKAALEFQGLKTLIKEVTGKEVKLPPLPPDIAALVFKRELDLAAKLADEEEWVAAEKAILDALTQYPSTRFTLTALDTLADVWIGMEDRDLELLSMVGYLAQWNQQQPDSSIPIRVTRRIAKYVDDKDDAFGREVALGALGRSYPNDPNAPLFLYRLGQAAAERGENKKAMDFYAEVMELYPQSKFALNVMRLQAEEAMKSGNFEAAVELYEKVKERAPEGLQRVNAMYEIANAKLKMEDAEQVEAGLKELEELKEELQPRPGSRYYEGDLAEKSSNTLQKVEFRIGYELLIQSSESKDPAQRERAAVALNSFLEKYPKSPNAPQVMFNLGRLYLQQGQFDQATKLFDDLSTRYSDHPLGKDALYSLVKAALEENQIDVAQRAVQRMVSSPDDYGPRQMFQVGTLMLENDRHAEAMDSFALVLKSIGDDDDTLKQHTLLKMGEAGVGAGGERLQTAADALEELIKEYPKSLLVLDAGISLSEIYLAMEPPQTEKAKKALSAASEIIKIKPNPVKRNEIGIASGQIALAEGKPGVALTRWYGIALFKPETDEEREVVREAMLLALELGEKEAQQDPENWVIVEELARLFVEYLPMDTLSSDMVNLATRAATLKPQEN